MASVTTILNCFPTSAAPCFQACNAQEKRWQYPKNRRTNACSCVAFFLSKQIDLRCRQDALDWMPPVTSMASMHNQVNMPMLQGSLESVTPYLQLDISWRNPRWYPLSPPKKVHKIFDTKVSNCLGQTKLTKQNHSLFQAIPSYPSSIYIYIYCDCL